MTLLKSVFLFMQRIQAGTLTHTQASIIELLWLIHQPGNKKPCSRSVHAQTTLPRNDLTQESGWLDMQTPYESQLQSQRVLLPLPPLLCSMRLYRSSAVRAATKKEAEPSNWKVRWSLRFIFHLANYRRRRRRRKGIEVLLASTNTQFLWEANKVNN